MHVVCGLQPEPSGAVPADRGNSGIGLGIDEFVNDGNSPIIAGTGRSLLGITVSVASSLAIVIP